MANSDIVISNNLSVRAKFLRDLPGVPGTRGICCILFFFSFLTFCVILQQIGRHSAPLCLGFVFGSVYVLGLCEYNGYYIIGSKWSNHDIIKIQNPLHLPLCGK